MPTTIEIVSPLLTKRLEQLSAFIGNTPLFPLHHLSPKPSVKIWAKLEWQQLGGSVKSRPAFQIVKHAITSGKLQPGMQLLDATSGNTGIAYGTICAALGIPVTLCLPANASKERKQILNALGVNLILTPPYESTDGAQEHAKELYQKHPEKYFYADQYANDQNWLAHYHHTAPEIVRQTNGEITHFVAGLGTTGSFTGTGKKLKEFNPGIHLTALQPDSPMHGLEGWKYLETAHVPAIYQSSLPDSIDEVSTQQALALMKITGRTTGLLLSPSAAANLAGALAIAEKIDQGEIVTLFADNAEKYGDLMKEFFN